MFSSQKERSSFFFSVNTPLQTVGAMVGEEGGDHCTDRYQDELHVFLFFVFFAAQKSQNKGFCPLCVQKGAFLIKGSDGTSRIWFEKELCDREDM